MSEIEPPENPQHSVDYPGDPRHPEHDLFITALGEATYMAARLAGICFDILRVFDRQISASLYPDPLGTLQRKVAELARNSETPPPRLLDFAARLAEAVMTRNDLTHALPVKDGLLRHRGNVRIEFYSVESVQEVTARLDATWRLGSEILYHDGGASIEAWYRDGGS
ncbi:hypothetical protein ACI2LF_06050 [Kribbella sp. NPDC020789]